MIKNVIQESRDLYGIDDWGSGYFGISEQGTVEVYPFGNKQVAIDLAKIVDHATEIKVKTPFILRFPQILDTQLTRIQNAFRGAMEEFKYDGELRAVFPFKVNQRKEFIDDLVSSGKKHIYGLEVGTKPELFAALAYDIHPEALFVCNGFKDSHFIELAFDAKKMGKNVVLVIEGTDELKFIINHAKKVGFCVDIGLRAKLYSKGSGMWEKSGGIGSKFGLNSVEMIEALYLLEEAGLKEKLVMIHYHIGSQITEIKKVKSAMKEAARVYAKILKSGFNLRYLNIGGGIGVDYDGSKTSFYVSHNYTIQEFANDVIYIIQDVCKSENCKTPHIVSESGRAVAAYHAVLITDVREVEKTGGDLEEWKISPTDHRILGDMINSLSYMNGKNFVEYFHDALQYRDELFTLFSLGYLEIEERAKAEVIYYALCKKALNFYRNSGMQLEEFDELEKNQFGKYMANFSMFQSIPDTLGIDQLFPVMPITRLNERTDHHGVIMDLTCDSDGCLDKFVDKRDVKHSLALHIPKSNESYYIGFFLVGAYQEALGNNHNLFGAVNELVVRINHDGKISSIEEVKGEDIGEILRIMNYKDEEIISSYEMQLKRNVAAGIIDSQECERILKKVKDFFNEYPYLVRKSTLEIVG
ncbi:biosynthetic arginine decarboxylase [Pigmentibacter sp. JX0631]|uniref:biosynthetic arginine decarboxylase n=1 Tax=Pigmentibacter sp. JX0631 TaxID=2976982 RepID=UPI0024697CF4|nr:biosynthetic arginine decarboxylase [Pigmentibacter sp. JX0631]WGL59478.1 biosynthetic arginine decarboxylase [Pigmentibacter sp. JX0631]